MPKNMILGIIIGAGASASINPNSIPVMNNFFEIVADFAQRDKQVAKTLKTLQKYGLVSLQKIPKGNLEDVLTQTLSLPREQEDPWDVLMTAFCSHFIVYFIHWTKRRVYLFI